VLNPLKGRWLSNISARIGLGVLELVCCVGLQFEILVLSSRFVLSFCNCTTRKMSSHLEVLMLLRSQAKPLRGDVDGAKQRRLGVRRSSELPLYNPAAMSTLMRTLRNLRKIGFKVSVLSSFLCISRN
jgi:hypothetical protein